MKITQCDFERQINEGIRRKIKTFLKTSKNGNSIPKLVGYNKSILRGKFIVTSAYIKVRKGL